jgi:hypothetical protein
MQQQIGFCSTVDGVRIAYATVGAAPPLVLSSSPAHLGRFGRSRAFETSGKQSAAIISSSAMTRTAVVFQTGTAPTFRSTPKFEPSRPSSKISG